MQLVVTYPTIDSSVELAYMFLLSTCYTSLLTTHMQGTQAKTSSIQEAQTAAFERGQSVVRVCILSSSLASY